MELKYNNKDPVVLGDTVAEKLSDTLTFSSKIEGRGNLYGVQTGALYQCVYGWEEATIYL